MNPNNPVPQPSNINWQAIHQAYNEHKGLAGAKQPVPQPEAVHPMHALAVEAMSRMGQKPGEDHGSMIIRALTEHLKRISPNVGDVHKQPTSGGA